MTKRILRFQFNLRTLAFLVAVTAILLLTATRYYESIPGPRIPFGTDPKLVAALHDAFKNFPPDYKATVPGWPRCTPTNAMNDIMGFGDEAIPALVANINNPDQYMRVQTYMMLSMMDAESAAPALIAALQQSERPYSTLLIAALTDISGQEEGYNYYRWYSEDCKPEAVRLFDDWYTTTVQKTK